MNKEIKKAGNDYEYDNESIRSLKGADRVRKQPNVIFGSDSLEGVEQAYFEILSNSVDEAKDGYGDRIDTVVFADGSIEIRDYGRGVPVDWNPAEKMYNWHLVFNELYSGAKFGETGNYTISLGIHGLGAAATQYASEYFNVVSTRDGYEHTINFKKGIPIMSNGKPLPEKPTKKQLESVIKKKKSKNPTGTVIKWKMDLEVFRDIEIPVEHFLDVLKRQSIVHSNIKFGIKVEEGYMGSEEELVEEFFYEEGILGYVKELSSDKSITEPIMFSMEGEGKDRDDLPTYKMWADVAFVFNSHNPTQAFYHNSSPLVDGGSPLSAIRSAFIFAFDKELKRQKKYKANEKKVTFGDIEDSLIIISSSFSTFTSYAHQTKRAINNKFIQDHMTEELKEALRLWIIQNKQQSDRVLEQILVNKRSRETAEKSRINVRRKLLTKVNPFSNNVKKFVDCRSKDVNEKELFIVEGDSALGSVKDGRDARFQGIMPVRGKILNTLKSSVPKIMKSDVITDLIKVMGCGVELPSKSKNVENFNLDNLQWNKIIITTDADVDGFQIRTLILAMLYRLTPTLIKEGYVYIAETPLYEITLYEGKKEVIKFAFDEMEKDEIIKGHEKYKLQRSKGLGENDPQMMWDTTLNPETRRLIQVTPEDAQTMDYYFELFLGNNLQGRKDYIEEYGKDYMADLDID